MIDPFQKYQIPNEIMMTIFENLSATDLYSSLSTCKWFREITQPIFQKKREEYLKIFNDWISVESWEIYSEYNEELKVCIHGDVYTYKHKLKIAIDTYWYDLVSGSKDTLHIYEKFYVPITDRYEDIKNFITFGFIDLEEDAKKDEPGIALAVWNNDYKLVKLLLELGADPNTTYRNDDDHDDKFTNSQEITLKDIVCYVCTFAGVVTKSRCDNMVNLLDSYGAKTTDELEEEICLNFNDKIC